MRTQASHPLARQAVAALSRRASLLTLGGAALLASASNVNPSGARKKRGAGCKKKEQQRCANDVDRCRTTVLLNCGEPGGCFAAALCCEECTARRFLTCAIANAAS